MADFVESTLEAKNALKNQIKEKVSKHLDDMVGEGILNRRKEREERNRMMGYKTLSQANRDPNLRKKPNYDKLTKQEYHDYMMGRIDIHDLPDDKIVFY